ncbi:MAG: hypothetical protein KA116_09220 [Proteobacteria bacterium]|nr:hypothetical protein [Pseudomonadota bacterium]
MVILFLGVTPLSYAKSKERQPSNVVDICSVLRKEKDTENIVKIIDAKNLYFPNHSSLKPCSVNDRGILIAAFSSCVGWYSTLFAENKDDALLLAKATACYNASEKVQETFKL